MVDSSNKRWPVIQDILKREGIARQHLNSFDEFLERGLQSIINEVGQIDIENAEYPYKIQLGKVKLQQPRMMELDGSITHITPAEARLRNVSYSAPVMMEASVVEDGKILESRFVHIGDVPVMAKSNACILHNFSTQKLIEHGEDPSDPGGYFIINGSERVIVGLEDLSYNKIIVDRETVGGNICGSIPANCSAEFMRRSRWGIPGRKNCSLTRRAASAGSRAPWIDCHALFSLHCNSCIKKSSWAFMSDTGTPRFDV